MLSDTTDQQSELNRYLLLGLVLSAILHVALIWALNPLKAPKDEAILVVDLIPSIPEPKFKEPTQQKQIVSPSQTSSETAPKLDTRLLSDRDSSVEKEQIKRGDDPNSGKVIGKQLSSPPSQAAKQFKAAKAEKQESNSEGPPKKLTQLRLDSDTMREKFAVKSPHDPKTMEEEVQRATSGSASEGYRTFSRPIGAGAAVLGTGGSPDYLPNLPDGDITMLNAKASRFAVFVRRVATGVFSQLRSQGWDSLRGEDIVAISQPAIMRATLSPQGKLMGVTLLRPSGSDRFDQVLSAAVKAGARDPNPPKEAADENGNFSFIFQSQSWAKMALSRNGAPTQRRWLLLATGLE